MIPYVRVSVLYYIIFSIVMIFWNPTLIVGFLYKYIK